MTSDGSPPREAFVWIWLPGRTAPVVAGRLQAEAERLVFTYGRSYLARDDAIPVHLPELPLRRGIIEPEPPLPVANALRDASPDAWGRRVIAYRLSSRSDNSAYADVDELTFMLESGSNRSGALDFQASPKYYVPRETPTATVDDLLTAAECLERGESIPSELAEPLQHGSSIGGARPKAVLKQGDQQLVAKFSSSNDTFNVVKAEFIAMRLAHLAGLEAAPVLLVQAMGRDVLLVRRFDRELTERGWTRRAMVSGLTLLGLGERFAAHASYEDLADIVRARFTAPLPTLRELFARMTFNILVGNTDDHARNHAAFWDGAWHTLTPAYDICPQSRTGREASQAMQIHGSARRSQLSLCLAAAPRFRLAGEEAVAIMKRQITTIRERWDQVSAEARLGPADRRLLWRRQFLNELAFEGLEDRLGEVARDLLDRVRPEAVSAPAASRIRTS